MPKKSSKKPNFKRPDKSLGKILNESQNSAKGMLKTDKKDLPK